MAIDSFRWSGCGDFILTISIAFFYPFGLTSIVMLQDRHGHLKGAPKFYLNSTGVFAEKGVDFGVRRWHNRWERFLWRVVHEADL